MNDAMRDRRTVIVLRYDDYGASRGERDKSKDDVERQLLDVVVRQGVPLTLGVVPRLEGRWALGDDAVKLGALREAVRAGRAEAALHGYTHEALARVGNRDSEFAGLPPAQQAERLRAGKALLEEWLGVPATSFIPPWNAADAATGAALAESGFEVLSASLVEPKVEPAVIALPHTCGLPQVRRAVRGLARHPGPAILVCTCHEFSFAESAHPLARTYGKLTLAQLDALLGWCQGRPGVEFLTMTQAARTYREPLLDGRVDEARELWRLLLGLRRVPVVGRWARRRWTPLALARPGWHARAARGATRLARWLGAS